MAKIVGKMLGWVGYTTGIGTNNWADDNDANLRKIDALLQAGAIAIQNTPPGSPTDGQVYVVGTAPTGAWATHANEITRYNGATGVWEFFAPTTGWWIAVGGVDYRWDGTAWGVGWGGVGIPAETLNTLGVALFGGTGKPTAYGYQPSQNRGIAFRDSRAVGGWKGGLFSSDDALGFWQDADTSDYFKPVVIGDATGNVWYKHDSLDASWKHYFTGNTRFSANVNAIGAIQQNSVDAITSTRAGRLTGLRLANLSIGQIPVSSDANGEITASGLTDDGTFLTSTRTLRLWNALARSGNTWTELQWAQNAEERVSILSSNGSGQYAYHQWVFAPADTEASGRVLGGMLWGQKLSGKSGSNPGLKAGMYAVSAGAGGSTGGFGARLAFNYRPDNGNSLVDALRIGAFGVGTADAVEAAILLRALAGIDAGLATFQSSTLTQPGIDFNCSNASSQAHIRILNSAAGNLLGGGIGDVEFTYTSTNRLRIGTNANQMILGGGEIVIEGLHIKKGLVGDVSPRTGSASTAAADVTVAYTGTGGHTESMPAATGSGRIIVYANAGTGTWTLDADGTDGIYDGGISPTGSISIVAAAVIRTRILQDIGVGVWMRLN